MRALRRRCGRALRALGRGELGSVRVLVGIAGIWTIFQLAHDRFLSAVNLSNLTPHPFRVFLDYSHPPVLVRIDALRRL